HAVAGELGDRAQQRARLDDALDDGEDAALRLLEVVGQAVALGVAAAIQQHHDQHDDGGQRGLARLLNCSKNQLGKLQPAAVVELESELKKPSLGFVEHKRFAALGIAQ